MFSIGRFLKIGRHLLKINVCHNRPVRPLPSANGMDKLEFIMKDTTCDTGVHPWCAIHSNRSIYEKRHTFGIGRIMDNRFPRHHTRTAFAETTDFVNQSRLHRGVHL